MAEQTPLPATEASNPTDAQNVLPSKVVFGFSGYTLPNPKFAEAAFEVYLAVISGVTMWIAGTHLLSQNATNEFLLAITASTLIAKNVLKLFGVQVQEK